MPFPPFVSMLLSGTLGGLVFWKLKVPSGALIGAMLGVVAYKFLSRSQVVFPEQLNLAVQILIGISVGSLFQMEMVSQLKALFWPVAISCLVLVSAGMAFSFVLIKLNMMNTPTAYLSTSPGAMTALLGLAMDAEANLPLVMTFHFFRIFFVIVTAPAILAVIRLLVGRS